MKICKIDAINLNAGWRIWTFVKIETNQPGLVGWAEVSESNGSVCALNAALHELSDLIIGQDPRNVNRIKKYLSYRTRQSAGSIIKKATSGIENACLDILAKDCGKSVMEIFGGAYYDSMPIYWSHFGTTRARASQHIEMNALKSYADLERLCAEVHAKEIKVVKTNMVLLDDEITVLQPGFAKPCLSSDTVLTGDNLSNFEKWISHMRAFLGGEIKIAVDINFNFDIGTIRKIIDLLIKYNIEWLELDSYDVGKIAKLTSNSQLKIVTGENIIDRLVFDQLFELNPISGISVDPLWIGFTDAFSVLEKAELRSIESYVHNFNGHISTFIAMQLGFLIRNVSYLEYDIDDVPWREEVFTNLPTISNGKIIFGKNMLGWGTELIESKAANHIVKIM
jgi:L-alanine-DL-glutamate epimerase-like enolase superfamily enzyme